MTHKASRKFWKQYQQLAPDTQKLADKAFSLLKQNSSHPSLHFKKLDGSGYWSVRISENFRALAVEYESTLVWFWIGPHNQYEREIRRKV